MFDGAECLVEEWDFFACDNDAIFECVNPDHLFRGIEHLVIGHEVWSLLDCLFERGGVAGVHCGCVQRVECIGDHGVVVEVFEHAGTGTRRELGKAVGFAGEHEHVLGKE